MKRIISLILIVTSSTCLFAQDQVTDEKPLNNLNLNLLGDASLISANYEKLFSVSASFFITGKVGIGYNEVFEFCFFGPCDPSKFLTIPHHITANFGKGRSYLELGLGGTLINGNTNQHYLLYPIVGYRLHPLKSNRLNFRVFGHVPVTGLKDSDILFSPLGLSSGITF